MKDEKHVILIIDDDQDFLVGMRAILEAAGYLVEEATSAAEGLEVFADTRPDLVIVDLMMEEIDAGTSFVKELRASGKNVPIYMYSSVGVHLDHSVDFSALGLSCVFQKPVDTDRLLETLQREFDLAALS